MEHNQVNIPTYRKPAIFVKLPSQGQWWPKNSINISNPSGEIGVYPMTVRDEMALRTPDALMNGEAVVSVIKSCIPDIKDPWHCSTVDLDTLLVAIRIATYGPKLDMDVSPPVTAEKFALTLDLNTVFDMIDKTEFIDTHQLSDGTVIKVKPMNYKNVSDLNIKNYEQARLANTISKSDMDEATKMTEIQKAFSSIANLTVSNIASQITYIKFDETELQSSQEILTFIADIPAPVANEIKDILASQKNIGTIKPLKIQTPKEQVDKGAPKQFDQKLVLDYANFFGLKS